MCMYVCTVCMYVCMYTYIHTYTHTHTLPSNLPNTNKNQIVILSLHLLAIYNIDPLIKPMIPDKTSSNHSQRSWRLAEFKKIRNYQPPGTPPEGLVAYKAIFF